MVHGTRGKCVCIGSRVLDLVHVSSFACHPCKDNVNNPGLDEALEIVSLNHLRQSRTNCQSLVRCDNSNYSLLFGPTLNVFPTLASSLTSILLVSKSRPYTPYLMYYLKVIRRGKLGPQIKPAFLAVFFN